VEKLTPSQIRKSITPDALISFVDGWPYTSPARPRTRERTSALQSHYSPSHAVAFANKNPTSTAHLAQAPSRAREPLSDTIEETSGTATLPCLLSGYRIVA
ncbi:MucR family transcriptional regulator, partial [Methylobacterium sp. E-066]|nr:MucR family transcriptional regulator [Methylobacterium sp. E-066]